MTTEMRLLVAGWPFVASWLAHYWPSVHPRAISPARVLSTSLSTVVLSPGLGRAVRTRHH